MHRVIMVCVSLCSLLLILPITAHSAPVITNDLGFIDNRPSGDIFGYSGLNLNLDVNATDSGGSGALTGGNSSHTAVPSNGSYPFSPVPIPLNLNAVFTIIGGAEFTKIQPISEGQFSSVTGTYTFTITNATLQTTTSTSHNLDKPAVILLPTNLTFSDHSTTPVFSFTDPIPTPSSTELTRFYQMEIFDFNTKTNIYQSAFPTSPTFSVPSGILQEGMSYYFRAGSLDIDNTEPPGTIHARRENRALEYATFSVPVPEPATMLLLGSGLLGLVGLRRKLKR